MKKAPPGSARGSAKAQAQSDLVRKYYSAYETKDRKALEGLLSDDFRFSSPLDDRIDRAAYFKRCWPNSERIRSIKIEKLFENGNEACVRYESEHKGGARFRNTELLRIEGNKIRKVDVYFGRDTKGAESKGLGEAEIRRVVEDRAKAVRAKDVDGAMSRVAPDILSFDVVYPLRSAGSDASRKRAEEWFRSFQGATIGLEIRDLSVTAGDDVAFCHSLSRVNATRADGNKLDMWWRATVCLRKIDGTWMITHEHNSVPFDVETGKASLGLKP